MAIGSEETIELTQSRELSWQVAYDSNADRRQRTSTPPPVIP